MKNKNESSLMMGDTDLNETKDGFGYGIHEVQEDSLHIFSDVPFLVEWQHAEILLRITDTYKKAGQHPTPESYQAILFWETGVDYRDKKYNVVDQRVKVHESRKDTPVCTPGEVIHNTPGNLTPSQQWEEEVDQLIETRKLGLAKNGDKLPDSPPISESAEQQQPQDTKEKEDESAKAGEATDMYQEFMENGVSDVLARAMQHNRNTGNGRKVRLLVWEQETHGFPRILHPDVSGLDLNRGMGPGRPLSISLRDVLDYLGNKHPPLYRLLMARVKDLEKRQIYMQLSASAEKRQSSTHRLRPKPDPVEAVKQRAQEDEEFRAVREIRHCQIRAKAREKYRVKFLDSKESRQVLYQIHKKKV